MQREPIQVGLLVGLTFCNYLVAGSTIDPDAGHVYSANAGWINALPGSVDGLVVSEAFLRGYLYSANFGWIHVGNGAPANGFAYSNASGTDYGVNHQNNGNLSGYAYAANIGWISFNWASASDPQRPRIDLATGIFSGFAYGANVGWIQLGSDTLATTQIKIIDTDGDGIPDWWEYLHFGDLGVAGFNTDYDGDGQSDFQEWVAGSDPKNPNDFLRIDYMEISPTFDAVVLNFSTTHPGRFYRVQTSTTMANDNSQGAWADVSELGLFQGDPLGSMEVVFDVEPVPRRFFRIVAQPPLIQP